MWYRFLVRCHPTGARLSLKAAERRPLQVGQPSPGRRQPAESPLVNLTDEEIIVPIGTIVSTQDITPIRFATTEEISIPTGSDGISVPVVAIQPGSSGNVSAEEIIAIEGSLGLNLTVINRNRITGGSDFRSNAPDEADYQRVYDQLFTSLQETAFTEFEFSLEPGDLALTNTPSVQQTLEEIYSPEAGQPSDILDLTLRLEFQNPYVDGADLYQLGRAVLDRHITEGFTPQPETMQITQLTKPAYQGDGDAFWKMQAAWQMGANLDVPQAISLVLGSSPEKAAQQLRDQMPLEDRVEIKLVPSWWPTLPILPFRVAIINTLESSQMDSAANP